jgi:hypothetical protein
MKVEKEMKKKTNSSKVKMEGNELAILQFRNFKG